MRSLLFPTLAAAALSLAAAPLGGPGTARSDGDPPRGDFVVRCGTLITGAASAPTLRDVWLVVRDGRVAEIRKGDAPDGDLPIVDAADKVVIPGLVAADSNLSGLGDEIYNVTPDLQALDGFDFLREFPQALAGGVTSAYLSPGRNRLVSGQGAVVKLAGDDIVQRVLAEQACLRVTLGQRANSAPPIFEPVIHPTSEDPLTPAERQFPSARISQLETLRELFTAAARMPEGAFAAPIDDGANFVETRYDPTPLNRAARGDLPLRVDADERADVLRALRFAAGLDSAAPVVLENPLQVEGIANALAAAGARVVLRMPVRLGDNNPGGENRADDRTRAQPENAAALAAAGVTVAIAPQSDDDLRDLLMMAAMAVRFGLDEGQALAGVTRVAAEVLGVADRVGSLEVGKDADFLVLSGAPLAVGTMVEQTWIDGVRQFNRDTETSLLAVRVANLHTGTGEVLDDGVILVQDGRIKAVGKDLAMPYGARVIDLREQGGVMVPGFVDAFSGLGLSGDGTGVPGGSPGQQLDRVVRHDDPVFAGALHAGITTVLTSGRDGGPVSGRVAAIKLGAADHESQVIDAIAGQRFVFDALGDNAIKPLADQIARGKKYLEAWQKYEKAVAEFEAGKGEKPKEAEPAAEEPAAGPDPVAGVWECSLAGLPVEINMTARLRRSGSKVTGTVAVTFPGRGEQEQDVEGTFQGKELRLKVRFGPGEADLVATLDGDSLTGTIQAMGRELQVTGKRTSKDAGTPAAKKSSAGKPDDGSPKKPEVDQNLEPFKELLEGKATAVIRVGKAPAISAVLELFRKEKIRFALHGADDAVDTPELLGDEPPPVLLGPTLVTRERGVVKNWPALLADADVPVVLVTGDVAGSRYLPLHAAHAVRYGLSPETALRALTIEPARAFGIDHRVGSLERGKDADFAVFSGNPFETTSRPLLVVCNGRVAFHSDATEASTR